MGGVNSNSAVSKENEGAPNDIILRDNSKYGEFDQLFVKFDINNDGMLISNEIVSAVQHYAKIRPEFASSLDELLSDMDPGKPINREDFRELLTIYAGTNDNEDSIIDAFKCFDKNLTGRITVEEVCHVFSKLGLNLNEEQGKVLVNEADKNNDHEIDFEEFINILISK